MTQRNSHLTQALRGLAAAAVMAALSAAPALAQQLDGLKIIAPAAPGGGWDQTAREMQAALQAAGIASGVQVSNVAGAGGTIGLAQFANMKGDAKSLMVGGLVMVGAVITNKSPVTMEQVTPIARLTGEYEAIVVPAASPIKSMSDLVAKLKADPTSVSWAGGSAGGTDHILVGLIAKAAGVDPSKVNYVPFSGGGEALAALLGNHVTAGVSGLGEFVGQIKDGKLRALAVSAPQKLPMVDAPTLKDAGLDVELVNWRGVVAPPGISKEQQAALSQAVGRMVQSAAWKDILAKRDWMDLYMPAEEFNGFLKQDIQQVTATLKDIGLTQ